VGTNRSYLTAHRETTCCGGEFTVRKTAMPRKRYRHAAADLTAHKFQCFLVSPRWPRDRSLQADVGPWKHRWNISCGISGWSERRLSSPKSETYVESLPDAYGRVAEPIIVGETPLYWLGSRTCRIARLGGVGGNGGHVQR
jgi:hypothetical protein